jgi:hypothetical protein
MKQIIISHWKFSFTYVKLEDFMTFHEIFDLILYKINFFSFLILLEISLSLYFFLNSIFYYKNEC